MYSSNLASNNESDRIPQNKPGRILQTLFKKFSGQKLHDTVPAGISKHAVMGGRPARASRFFKGLK
jgi:hypothetical protein